MDREKPLLSTKSIIKGAAAGGLLAGAFIIQTALVVKFIFFISGFLVILDAVLPVQMEKDYPLLSLIGFVIGFLIALGFSIAKLDIYVILLLLATAVIYAVKLAKKAGIDGFILPDMPVEESKEYLKAIHKNNADAIFLISPNTTKERIKKIVKAGSGFLYLVSVYGTTGKQQEIQQYTIDAIKNTKKIVNRKIPLGVGFGVSNQGQAKFIIKCGADAVIVGSAFLRLIEILPQKKIESGVASFTKNLKMATKPQ